MNLLFPWPMTNGAAKYSPPKMAAQTDLIPCILERKILPKVWGGRSLESVLGIELPAGQSVGETWELYDRPDGSSAIRDSDKTLRDLMEQHPEDLLGRGVEPTPQGRFPLLLKFIDAQEPLSVQVHPDAAMASEVETDAGKNEAWIVLQSGEGGRILLGTREGVTHEELAKVAHTAAVEELLHAFRPQVGEAIYVPAGTVHAIGPEVVLFEIQQNADVTYRLYDWGRARETQIDKGLAAAARGRANSEAAGVQQAESIAGGGEWLLRTPHFRVRRFRASVPATLGTEGTVKILTVIRGGGMLGWRSGGVHRPLPMRAGDTTLIPACTETVFLSPAGELEFFWADTGV